MLGVLASASGYTNNYQNRLNAMSLMSKFLSSPVMGDEASTSLRRYPLTLVHINTHKYTSMANICELIESRLDLYNQLTRTRDI